MTIPLASNSDQCTPQIINIRRKIVDCLVDYQHCWHRSPRLSEIEKMFSGMTDHLKLHLAQLEREGLIHLDGGGEAGISVVATMNHAPRISASLSSNFEGCSIEEGEPQVSLSLDLRRLGIPMDDELEAMEVTDGSMLDAGFELGDLVILRIARPKGGDIVAVEIDGRRILRRYLIIANIPHLLAENPNRPDLHPAWDHPICGVYWGTIRVTGLSRIAVNYPVKKRINYSEAQKPLARRTENLVASTDYRPAPSKKVKKSGDTPKKIRKADLVHRVNMETDWPKPPSGIELNESSGTFRMTEDAGTYDTWGPQRTRKHSSKSQNR